jgi:hypothetical protein
MPFPWLGAHVGLTFTRLFLLGGLALYEECILVFVPRAVVMIHGNNARGKSWSNKYPNPKSNQP